MEEAKVDDDVTDGGTNEVIFLIIIVVSAKGSSAGCINNTCIVWPYMEKRDEVWTVGGEWLILAHTHRELLFAKWITTDRPIILSLPNKGRSLSLYTSLILGNPSREPYLLLRSPTSYWSLVP